MNRVQHTTETAASDCGLTRHAQARAQQRALPAMILDWLHAFGEEEHVGSGTVILVFNKRARRRLERALGREQLRRMKERLNA